MREFIDASYLDIPREDREVEFDGEVFSTADTAVWIYPEQYSAYNYVIREEDDESYSRWFAPTQPMLDAFHEAGITFIHPPYPQREVVLGFWAVELTHLDEELDEITESGEIPPSREDYER